ncbi:MAG: CheY-P phosphatase CheC [Firmicutes bacterium]|nr:CheY-P phosphatase CheC [candidate division NPL-UPA2 bacterium]
MQFISTLQLDVMNEIGNMGAGHAATALSLLMGRKVDMAVPETKFLSIEAGCAELSREGEVGVGVEVGLSGSIDGLTLLTVDEDGALHLLLAFGDMLAGQGLDDALAQSALMEIGNIVTGSFLTAITDFLGESSYALPPRFIHDYFDAFVCNVIVAGCRNVDGLLVFKTELKVDDRCVSSDLAFLPSQEAFGLIMNKILSAGGMS